jgi:dolichol-phosphate mannosyltransferase
MRRQYVGMLNVDMEDPPDQIPLLLREIERGDSDIVWGLRRARHAPFLVHATSVLFSFVLNKATGYDIPLNVATLRVMNRSFVDAYNELTEKGRYIPGLEMWLGFRRGYVDTRHQARAQGHSSYTFAKRLRMAFEAIVSFSDLPPASCPARLFDRSGRDLSRLFLVVGKLFFTDYEPGHTSTISTMSSGGADSSSAWPACRTDTGSGNRSMSSAMRTRSNRCIAPRSPWRWKSACAGRRPRGCRQQRHRPPRRRKHA